MKRCHRCTETKDLAEFSKDRRARDGYQAACKPCRREQNAKTQAARSRKHYEANRDAMVARAVEWDQENRERRREINRDGKRRRYHADPEASRARSASYEATRRARKKGAGSVEHIDRREIYERDQGICHICEQPVDFTDMHLDHVVPLARGGDHTHDNVATSHAACNIRKGARDIAPVNGAKDPFRKRR